jgi:hypothetical protein
MTGFSNSGAFIAKGMVLCAFLTLILSILYIPTSEMERAHAGGAVVVVGGNGTFQETISAGADTLAAGSLTTLTFKETVLDGVAFAVINLLIQQMTQSIVSWINSGFQGDPSFIRDFDGFLTGIADRAVGQFIASDETLRFLCSPFRVNIQATLNFQYAKSRNYGDAASSCTLTGVAANLENFFDGNAIAGGWDQWFKVTQDPQYNPYGALLLAQEKMSVTISNSQGQEARLLDWGKGFLSSRECNTVENRQICRTVTPGGTIEAQLNEAISAPGRRVQVADEINEIIGALFTQLASQALSGVGGLLGLTGGGGAAAAGPTYYDTLATQPTGAPITPAQNPIQQAITTETTYRSLQQTIVTNVQNAANYWLDRYSPDSCHPGTLNATLQTSLTEATGNITTADSTIATLNTLLAQYNAAATDAAAQNAVMQQYLLLQSSGVLHNSADVYTVQNVDVQVVNYNIGEYTASIDTACRQTNGGQ